MSSLRTPIGYDPTERWCLLRMDSPAPDTQSENVESTGRYRLAIATGTCTALIGLAACGFGTSPGSPYDFSELEPLVAPISSLPTVEVIDRQERGSNCHGQGCARPLLTYYFRPEAPAGCELVPDAVATFQGVSQPFRPAAPEQCAYVGEVAGHAVTVGGRTASGDVLAPSENLGLERIEVGIFADRLTSSLRSTTDGPGPPERTSLGAGDR